MDVAIEDYYRIIEELDRDLGREENYQNLREALKKWSKRSGSARAKQMELKIKEAMRVFEDEELYNEYHSKLVSYFKNQLAKLVRMAVVNGKLPPRKKIDVIQEGESLLALKSTYVEYLLNEILKEEGIEVGDPDGGAPWSWEKLQNEVKEKSRQVIQDLETRIKKTSVFQDFEGSYRVLAGFVGSAVFLLIVHVTIGAIAGFWILLVTAGLYFWLKRRR